MTSDDTSHAMRDQHPDDMVPTGPREPDFDKSDWGTTDFNRFLKLLEECKSESDRAAAVLACAGLDDLLTILLGKILLPEQSQSMGLLRPDDPIGSLSAKIEIAYRIGAIGKDLHRELHLVRKIRNRFAHSTEGVSLSQSPLKDLVNELEAPVAYASESPVDPNLHKEYLAQAPLRYKFDLTIVSLTMSLQFLIENCKRLKMKPLQTDMIHLMFRATWQHVPKDATTGTALGDVTHMKTP